MSGPYVTVQLVPFHESTRPSDTPVELFRESPKPTQLVELVHERLPRESAPFSSGVVSWTNSSRSTSDQHLLRGADEKKGIKTH